MSNPALNDKVFQREEANAQAAFSPGWAAPTDGTVAPPAQVGVPDAMRTSGVVTATSVLLGLLLVAAWFGWQAVDLGPEVKNVDGTITQSASIPPWLFVAWIGGFGVAILTIFKPKLARITAPIYAVAEGLLVGAISAVFDAQWNGIVLQAVLLTIGVFAIMLVLFATGTIKVTNRLRIGIIAATGAIFLVYLADIILGFFSSGLGFVNDAGPMGIVFSLVVVAVAAFNLLLDFDFVQRAVAARAPRYLEWYAGFGLMVTLVWLYLEILRLLAKLRSN